MNLRELKWPVRIYWDLPADTVDASLSSRVADELIALKILFLSLRQTGPVFSVALLEMLRMLQGRGMAVALTLPPAAITPEFLESVRSLGVKTLLADFSLYHEAAAWFDAIDRPDTAVAPGLSFDVCAANYHEIPGVVSYCIRRGIRDLVFPIQRLIDGGEVFSPTPHIRTKLAEGLHGIDYSGLRITIHDPFLWQVFFPTVEYHEGGCQAANSMLYIAPDFRVYPCPAMPLLLGDLRETTFREIILSEQKQELRRVLLSVAGDCTPCKEAPRCLGGCRGRSLAAVCSMDRMDPACNNNA